MFSGYDVERWLLKTTAGLAASKSLASDRVRLPGIFARGIDIGLLLELPGSWQKPMGMYIVHKLGERFSMNTELEVAPLSSPALEIGGLLTRMHGFLVCLLLTRSEDLKGSPLEHAPYRLHHLYFAKGFGSHHIELSWG